MKERGKLSEFPELAAIVNAIFSKKMHFQLPKGDRLRTRLFKGKLFAVDVSGLRYVEQNPDSSSAYAQRVRNDGAKILWVIRTHRKVTDAGGQTQLVPCENQWVGRIENDVVYMS